jgi:hypothetical protein
LTFTDQEFGLDKTAPDDAVTCNMKLRLDANLYWHWNLRNEGLPAEITRDFEKLAGTDFECYAADSDCIVASQATWAIGNCLEGWDNQMRPKKSLKRLGQASIISVSCQEWRMERLACYSSAHAVSADGFGIHLTKRGIASLAYQVHQFCPDEPLEIVQMAAIYFLFAHQKCHAWIEDICCLIEFSTEEITPKIARNYTKAQERYNGYIFMEEAICNTATFGWLQYFLCDQEKIGESPLPAFNPLQILHAFECQMRQQPQGFRDFLPITQVPYISEVFVQNVCRLLVEIYGMDQFIDPWSDTACGWHDQIPYAVSDAVGLFFGGEITPDFHHYYVDQIQQAGALWSGELPVHVHD